MKKRPLSIKLLATLFLLSPIGIVAEILYFYKIPLSHWQLAFLPEIWTWQVVACVVLTPLMGLCVWTVHSWAYVALIAFFTLVLVNDIAVVISGSSLWDLTGHIVLGGGFVLLVLIAIRKEFYAPYFNPRLRWWENAHRYVTDRIRILVKDCDSGEVVYEAKSFDISETGIFVATEHEARIGTCFSMDILFPNGATAQASGEIVWIHGGSDQNPPGFGCRFASTSPRFKAELRSAIRELNAAMKDR
jgi:Tfp pilus assembly protein PilZ